MATLKKPYYITTPIYYVNDSPHIGHAYSTLAADVLARFKRLDGFDVKFVTGTDEHGQKIEKAANQAEMDTQTFIDMVSVRFRNLNKQLNFSNDDFIRTSEARHKDYVTSIWKRMLESGAIYLGKYAGWYAVRDEAFYAESELIDGKAPTGAEVEWVEEPSYFFRLSDYQEKLLAFYEANPDFIMPPSRRNEVVSFVKTGLHDLSVSRTSFSHGIPVPNDEKHVIYVWLDALFNYISVLGDENSPYWPCDIHIVGKDILRFHAIYWPAFLMAIDIPLPKRVFAHGWWVVDGAKMSKSLGNAIDPIKLVEEYGLDAMRYFLMREISFGSDGNYSEESFINRINAELANNIGNLAQRVLAFIFKNCNETIPKPEELLASDLSLLQMAYEAINKMRTLMDKQEIHNAIQVIIDLANAANEYVEHKAPWSLKNTDIAKMNSCLFVLAEVIRAIGILLQPFVPNAAEHMLNQLNIEIRDFTALTAEHAINGTKISQPTGVFKRLEVKA